MNATYDWYAEPDIETEWLIDGLIPADGYSAVVGKPKAGKSTAIRNIIVAVLKGGQVLGRSVNLPPDTGRVLYLQLDRKDKPARVSRELRNLGLSQEDAPRLTMRLAKHLPSTDFAERLEWLRNEVMSVQPHLVVIDLLWQFVVAKSSNDYNEVLAGINSLQDVLTAAGYTGALIAALHGRKATNPSDQFDDVLGSTGQRGSFSTNIMFTQYKKQRVYTIASDQTERDDVLGEITETVIIRNVDGTLSLGKPFSELLNDAKNSQSEDDLQRFLLFVSDHPGCDMETIKTGLSMSLKYALKLRDRAGQLVSTTGKGHKGDPFLHFFTPLDSELSDLKAVPSGELAAQALMRAYIPDLRTQDHQGAAASAR